MSNDLTQLKLDITKDANQMYEQSIAANEDMRFVNVDGGMWEDFLENEFENRTRLEFDLISDYVHRFLGEWNQNRIGVDYKPDDDNTSDDDAELLNGIYRADFRQNSGKLSIDNAVDEAATCGYGCFKLGTFFEDEGDPENDFQRIEHRPIYNAYNTVFWDAAAKRIDKRDAKRCTELIQFTEESFKEEYPEATPVSAYEPENNYFSSSYRYSQQKIIYVAKRYEVVKKKESVFIYKNLQSSEVEVYSEEGHDKVKDELKKDEFRTFVRERKITKQHVETTVFSGDEILEKPKRIAGKWIPIIPIYGYRTYVDGAEWYKGLVRPLKDASRLYNMQVSQLAENSASDGQEVPILSPAQIQGFEGDWADRNNKSYLLLNHDTDKDGKVLTGGGPAFGYLKPGALDQSTTTLMQVVPTYLQQVTGGAPQDTLDPDASGKAINALLKRENLNTQVINDNIANAVEWSGVVYEGIAGDGVYTTQRMVNTTGKDGAESRTQLLKTVLDEETGKPVESNNILGKKFRVYPDVGPQYETLREETVENYKGILEMLTPYPGAQDYVDAIIAVILENSTGVGASPIKELARKKMVLQGIEKPKTDEEKQMLADAQEQANQPDPQQQLVEAAAAQAEGEARERESKVLDNTASANKKTAETQQILADIELDQVKTLADIREQVFQSAQTGTLQ